MPKAMLVRWMDVAASGSTYQGPNHVAVLGHDDRLVVHH